MVTPYRGRPGALRARFGEGPRWVWQDHYATPATRMRSFG